MLHGWVDWPDGSTFRAAAQAHHGGLVMPYLQVKDASGNWTTVLEDMGMPAGKPKTIALGVNFPTHRREVRIVTNLCVYWDEIFHGMSRYPCPAGEHYPRTEAHDRYRREFNTRPALRLIRPLDEAKRTQ